MHSGEGSGAPRPVQRAAGSSLERPPLEVARLGRAKQEETIEELRRVFTEIAQTRSTMPSWDIIAEQCQSELVRVQEWIQVLRLQKKRGQLSYVLEALQGIGIVLESEKDDDTG